jgi:hypothetical protein
MTMPDTNAALIADLIDSLTDAQMGLYGGYVHDLCGQAAGAIGQLRDRLAATEREKAAAISAMAAMRDEMQELEDRALAAESEAEGVRRCLSGVQVGCSTSIGGAPTFGYGTLDANGFWEYPVPEQLVVLRREARMAEAELARRGK